MISTASADPVLPGTLVAIPTLNEAAHIEGVVGAILRDLHATDDVCVAVVDGGSEDGTRAIVARLAAADPRIVLLDNPRRIQSAALNLAVERLGGDRAVLIRCDAHSGYPVDYVRRLIASLDRTGADSVVVPMDSIGDTCVGRAIAWASDSLIGSGGSAHRGGRRSGFVDHGHHAAFRITSFRAAQGYDESFTHNEDAELDCRMRAGGARIFLDADIRIAYHARATFGGLWRQYRAYGRGRSRTMRRHPGSLRLRQIALPAFVTANLAALPAGLAWPAAWLLPLAYLLLLAINAVGAAIRHRARCGLLSGVAALTMHVGWTFGFVEGLVRIRERPWRPPAPAIGRAG